MLDAWCTLYKQLHALFQLWEIFNNFILISRDIGLEIQLLFVMQDVGIIGISVCLWLI